MSATVSCFVNFAMPHTASPPTVSVVSLMWVKKSSSLSPTSDVEIRRIAEVPGDFRVEIAEPGTGGEKDAGNRGVPRGKKGLRRRRISLGAGESHGEAENNAGAIWCSRHADPCLNSDSGIAVPVPS